MIANYLKIFIRLFLKQTAFTMINILGLAVGLACCLVIAVFVRHELSFDSFFTNADQLYRVTSVVTESTGEVRPQAQAPFPVGPMLADNFPAITDVVRVRPNILVLRNGDSAFEETEFKLVDPDFFRVFDFVWLEGDPGSALSGTADVIVTRSFSEKYFGEENALGQSVLISDGRALRVTGVVEDLPVNTHLSGSLFVSTALRDTLRSQQPWDDGAFTYVVLPPEMDSAQFEQELDAFARANIPRSDTSSMTLRLDPITDIHLNPVLGDWKRPGGNKLSIAVFSAIGVGILLIACANFVNLSTARSAQRFKEVGLRLTLGAGRSQLLTQFLGEAVLFVLLAMVLALAFAELALPVIQGLLGLNLAYASMADPKVLATLLAAGLLLGLLAGWYPALLMSGHRPVAALGDSSRLQLRGLALKNVLVVFQFAIAIALLIASTAIYLQMRFTGNLDLKYDNEHVMIIAVNPTPEAFDRRWLLKERLLQGAGITAASMADAMPAQIGGPALINAEGSDTQHRLAWHAVDFDYLALYRIAVLSGRLHSAEMPTDLVRSAAGGVQGLSGSLVLNESGAREFGWSAEEAVGKTLFRDGARLQVIGVVADTIESAYLPVAPAIYAVPEDTGSSRFLAVKLSEVDLAGSMAFVERTWKDINPATPMTSIFVDELIAGRYLSETRRQDLAFLFTGMAVVISCMGLFGLANFNTQHRAKEIGVRKVMGGSVWSIVLLVTNDFSKLVLISNVIAWPVAWFAMNRWLENFAYRIDLTPMVFIGSGLIALCIAWVTVGGTAAKAASARPVLALRYE